MANIKVGDIENQVRLLLLDSYEEAYRFEPKEIYVAMLDAFRRIRTDRPESRYVDGLLNELGWNMTQINDTTNTVQTHRGTAVNMDEKWAPAVVYYTVHRMYLKDDPDTANATLADRYLAMYKEAVSA